MWSDNLNLSDMDIVAVTETNLDGAVLDAEVCSGGWMLLRRDRMGRTGGGVLLTARPGLALQRLQHFESDSTEDLWAKFNVNKHTIYVCVVYIPPNTDELTYSEWFRRVENICSRLTCSKVILLGDLNLCSAHERTVDYFNYFLSFCNFFQYNSVKNMKDRILDVVLTSSEICNHVTVSEAEPGEVLVNIDGYHPPLVVRIQYNFASPAALAEPSNIDPNRDWNFLKADFERLAIEMNKIDWSPLYKIHNVELAVSNFYDTIYDIFDHCVPKKIQKQSCSRTYPVYYTKTIIRDIRKKAHLHRVWKRTCDDAMYRDYGRLRSKIKTDIKKARYIYSQNVSKNLAKDPKLFWQFINSMRTKGGIEHTVTRNGVEYSGAAAAGAFASHFHSVYLPNTPTLDAELAGRGVGSAGADARRIDISVFTETEVRRAIRKLKPGSSPGPDGVPAYIIKGCIDYLSAPITYVFNLILSTGHYPVHWKVSRVTPIPKSGPRTMVENSRPVANLSSVPKVFESVVHGTVATQFCPFVSDAQHAFVARRSVATNLLSLVDLLSRRLDEGLQVDVVYLDLQKAFDRVDNDVLLHKLGAAGFVPRLLKLFASYFSGRKQFVKYGSYHSEPYDTRSGVSQGSILGPFFFVIAINDLPDVVSHAAVLLFADDVKLIQVVRSRDDCEALQRDINEILRWSEVNRLTFNPSKCEVMSFGRGPSPVVFDYSMGDEPIRRVYEVKDLGIIFDPRLTFRKHVRDVTARAFQRLGFVLRNSGALSEAAVRALYAALVRSVLETNSVVWSPHESKYILMLEQIQKRFLRFLYKYKFKFYPYLYPTKFIQGCLGYDSLEIRRSLSLVIFNIKILQNKIDCSKLVELLLYLQVPRQAYGRRNARRRLFELPISRTQLYENSPRIKALRLLNLLDSICTEYDIFVDSIACLVRECKRMLERRM